MAKSVITRDYQSADAMASGLMTFSTIEDAEDKITFDIAALFGGDKVWKAMSPYGRWSAMRDANNTHGDTFAGDPGGFKEASKKRHEKFVAGDFTTRGGGGKRIGDLILALMRVFDKTEDDVRKWYAEQPDDVQESLPSHGQVKLHIDDIRAERKAEKRAGLEVAAKDATALTF